MLIETVILEDRSSGLEQFLQMILLIFSAGIKFNALTGHTFVLWGEDQF